MSIGVTNSARTQSPYIPKPPTVAISTTMGVQD
ncbi:hypothetical protein BN1723_011838 [Verticillium longisporum]|uniref:Uncharacterized protein n=1 Tax=Verticillium longisporum TaxID=100787 RepID=A0A0G4LC05_VERLO|nr:hypothetical protein BN1723_011838 [Verticillium longisporum]